ncbi:sensor histidine kinase [Hydrogenoanaerobacterium sp.]|uniref:sensor histidine kinase n=1 Tax=Hydrogenoanaerobacterium sp. TaxID=2953763 RepID=UPI00289A5B29|nr:sensor histidine kinase [Hydrogenoanaerobacterium sp.]
MEVKAKQLHAKSINTRIVLSFSMLIATIIVFILSITSIVFTSRFMEQKNNLMLEKMAFITQDIEENINGYRKLTAAVKRDAVVKLYLENPYEDYDNLEQRLDELAQYTYGVERIILLDADFKILDKYYSMKDFRQQFMRASGMINIWEMKRDEFFSAPHNFPSAGSLKDYMENLKISYISVIRDDNFKVKGYIILNTARNYLFSGKQEYAKSLFDNTYIISKSGDIIYRFGDKDKYTEKQAVEFAQSGYFNECIQTNRQNTLFKQTVLSYPEWIVVGISSDANLKKDLNVIHNTIMCAGLLGLITVVVISRVISNKITQPIYSIKQAMGRFEQGEMPEKLIPTTEDELGYLVNGFNRMLDDISRFVDAIYHEQEEKKKAEVAALKFQLESLQSQINPHFLYNTLNTVSYLSLKNRTEEIRELIQSLNTLLRSTLSDQSELVTVEKEIYFLESYVKIQNYRYEDMIHFTYEVEDEALGCTLPKLILQPLVENSLLHGIYPKGTAGNVHVSIRCVDDGIHISVADNGIGIAPAILKTMSNKSKGFNRIGLKNVDERLQLYYGEPSKIFIESVVGEGTTVCFTIPKQS